MLLSALLDNQQQNTDQSETIMPRGIPWDDLPKRYGNKDKEDKPIVKEVDITPREVNFAKDSMDIGRRVAFGVVCGSLTGATFGFVDVLRDPKALAGKTKVATGKILRYSYLFAGFFGSYHGIRKALNLYNPQPPEINVITSALLCITPLIFVPRLRPLIPYGVMLVGLDALNGMNDI